MAKETWRDGSPKPTDRADSDKPATTWRADTAPAGDPAPASILRLPSALARQWKITREMESRGAEADLLIVENDAGDYRVAKIYRSGIQPKTDVLEKVSRNGNFKHVVEIFDHGRSDGRAYELQEYVKGGSLEDLIRNEGPKLPEQRVEEILYELLYAIQHVHANDVFHRDIKPSNILVRSADPLDLVLTDFGIASIRGGASRRFTSGHRTIAYSTPESAAGEVSEASDWWSLGIILVEILTGRHPFAGAHPGELLDDRAIMSRLAQMHVDQLADGVKEPWRTLCRGLLRREAKNRFTDDEVIKWIRRDPSLKVAEEAAPSSQRSIEFFFAGNRYSDLTALGGALAANWAEARKTIERGHLLKWANDEWKDSEWRQFLADLDSDKVHLDVRVFRIVTKMAPDETPVFRGHALDPAGLKKLANDATAGNTDAIETLRLMIDHAVLSIAASETNDSEYGELHRGLTAIFNEFRNFCDSIVGAGAPAADVPDQKTFPAGLALLTLLPQQRAKTLAELQARVQEASTENALACPWYRELSDASANSTAALLIMPSVARAADSQTVDRLAREDMARRQENYDDAYKNYTLLAGVSAGMLGGILVGFIPAWIFTGFVSFVSRPETGWAWYAFIIFVSTVVGGFVGYTTAGESRWVASELRDASEAQRKGLTYAIPSLILYVIIISYWFSLAGRDTAQKRTQTTPPIQQPITHTPTYTPQSESQRSSSLITSVRTGSGLSSGGQLIGETSSLRGPTPVYILVGYQNARMNSDRSIVTIFENSRSHAKNNCNPITLNSSSGSYWCRWDNLQPGNYTIQVFVNGTLARTTYFSLSQAASRTPVCRTFNNRQICE